MSESKKSVEVTNYKKRYYVAQKTMQEKEVAIFEETKIENEPIVA